ncbi:unnamed protein product [Effrenium voratum]|uniref:Uncharacterized protein n=1 Tax=Effrenium voratum TaxID=2562239 RepID=A0AA36N885_9DINO|nr:unnamed protein product [Effrenium voratum]
MRWYLSCLFTLSLGASLEDALENVTSQVTAKFGANFTLIEALACRNQFCAQKHTETMAELSEARFMRVVFIDGIRTTPNIEAQLDLSTMAAKLIRHEEPFTEDAVLAAWPPVSGLTFEKSFARIRSYMDASVQQVTFRRVVHPCASEDLFQFELNTDLGPRIISVGASSGNICSGFITEKVDLKMCPDPVCLTEMIAV